MPLETINMCGKGEGGSKAGGGGDFKATPEELRALQERMKDPKFVELMGEYMRSLSDPETRAEEEAYLEQAEREAREGGDFTFDFIFPRPVFVVELRRPCTTVAREDQLKKLTGSATGDNSSGRANKDIRTFINFCSSEKVDVFTEHTTGDARGSQWHVPVSVCEKRLEYYYENTTRPKNLSSASENNHREAFAEVQSAAARAAAAPDVNAPYCFVYDAVYHPQTLSLADRSNRFLCFLVEIAVEHINAGYKESHAFEFTRLPSAVLCVGYPKNQTIRKKGGESPFQVDSSAPVLTRPTKHLDAWEKEFQKQNTKPATQKASKQPAMVKEEKEKQTRSSNNNNNHSSNNNNNSAETLPPYQVKHRTGIDLADSWTDARVSGQRKVGVPEVLVVTLNFGQKRNSEQQDSTPTQRALRASDIDISVAAEGTGLQLRKTAGQPQYEGFILLPFSVEEDPISARFDKQQRILTLELRVQAQHLMQVLSHPEATTAEAQQPTQAEATNSPNNKSSSTPAPPTTAASAPAPPTTTSTAASAPAAAPAAATPAPPPDAPAPAPAASNARSAESVDAATATTTGVGKDLSRIQEMREKVEEARRAREAALEEMRVRKKEMEEATVYAEELMKTLKSSTTTTANTNNNSKPTAAEGAETHPDDDDATPRNHHQNYSEEKNEEEGEVYIHKADAPKQNDLFRVGEQLQAEEMGVLEARQSAWVQSIQAAMDEGEEREMAAAAKKARKDAEKARERYEAALQQEAAEVRARAKQRAAPLRNVHIFSID